MAKPSWTNRPPRAHSHGEIAAWTMVAKHRPKPRCLLHGPLIMNRKEFLKRSAAAAGIAPWHILWLRLAPNWAWPPACSGPRITAPRPGASSISTWLAGPPNSRPLATSPKWPVGRGKNCPRKSWGNSASPACPGNQASLARSRQPLRISPGTARAASKSASCYRTPLASSITSVS